LVDSDDAASWSNTAGRGYRWLAAPGGNIEHPSTWFYSGQFDQAATHWLRGALKHWPPPFPSRRGRIPVALLFTLQTFGIDTLVSHLAILFLFLSTQQKIDSRAVKPMDINLTLPARCSSSHSGRAIALALGCRLMLSYDDTT
jgi:hypothetical protein